MIYKKLNEDNEEEVQHDIQTVTAEVISIEESTIVLMFDSVEYTFSYTSDPLKQYYNCDIVSVDYIEIDNAPNLIQTMELIDNSNNTHNVFLKNELKKINIKPLKLGYNELNQ